LKTVKKIKTLIRKAEPVVDFLESWKKINPSPVALPKEAGSKEQAPVKAEGK